MPLGQALRVKRQGLRIAGAVAIGFTAAVATGEVLPFLGTDDRREFLMGSARPPGVRQAIG